MKFIHHPAGHPAMLKRFSEPLNLMPRGREQSEVQPSRVSTCSEWTEERLAGREVSAVHLFRGSIKISGTDVLGFRVQPDGFYLTTVWAL